MRVGEARLGIGSAEAAQVITQQGEVGGQLHDQAIPVPPLARHAVNENERRRVSAPLARNDRAFNLHGEGAPAH